MIKRLLLTIVATLMIAVPLLAPSSVLAASLFTNSKDAVCGGAQASDNPVTCDATASTTTVNGLITTGLNLLSVAIGVVSVIMIMVGGFKFITSQGEGANTASARNTILYAVAGLVVVVMAQLIVKVVLQRVSPAPPAPVKTTMIQTVKSLEVS